MREIGAVYRCSFAVNALRFNRKCNARQSPVVFRPAFVCVRYKAAYRTDKQHKYHVNLIKYLREASVALFRFIFLSVD